MSNTAAHSTKLQKWKSEQKFEAFPFPGFQEHVYFFFREGAVEHINCGKAVFSRYQ
jgi:hypothetical protein